MPRKRKDGDPLGLTGTRLALRRGKFWYRHRDGKTWEDVGTDVAAAKQRARLYNDPDGAYGTTGYWLDMFLADCEQRVKAGRLSARTLADYRTAAEMLKPYFGAMPPEAIRPNHVQAYLEANAQAGRPVPANRERACLSSMLSWLLRRGDSQLRVNPCMRGSGVRRNAERKRERYVTHEEYRAVFEAAPRSVRLMMELVYRTLQRPEIDVLAWTPANLKVKGTERVLRFRQSKTGRQLDIALTGRFGELVRSAVGEVPVLHQPLVHTLRGDAYSYDGISAMLKRAQRATGTASFGFRDLKGKGATDMWLAGEPIERIQLLCGHADARTTEIYIKARWSATAAPNASVLEVSTGWI